MQVVARTPAESSAVSSEEVEEIVERMEEVEVSSRPSLSALPAPEEEVVSAELFSETLTQRAETHTNLARATLWSRWQFAHGEARPLHSGSADTHANSPNVGISIAQFLVVGDCVRALP